MIKGVHHIAVRTSDLERAVKFYTEALSFKERLRLEFEDGSSLVQMELGGGIVELFGGGRGPAKEGAEAGCTHLALEVDDVDAECERLKGLDCEFYIEPNTVEGIRCAFFRDPDGIPIEILSE